MAVVGTNLWTDLVQLVELKAVERQKNKQFAEVLCRVWTGHQTDDDVTLLKTQTMASLGLCQKDPHLMDAAFVFYTNPECAVHNRQKIEELKEAGQQSVILDARDEFVEKKRYQKIVLKNDLPESIDRKGGLADEIEVP